MTNLMAAHNQWSNRPNDERFFTVDEMLDAAEARKNRCREVTLERADLHFEPVGDDGIKANAAGTDISLTNYGFKALCRVINAPVDSLVGKVSADTMCRILNERAERSNDDATDEDGNVREIKALIEDGTEGVTLRTVTSDRYERVWDSDTRGIFRTLAERGFVVPPCRPNNTDSSRVRKATAEQVGRWGNGGIQVKEGDDIGPGNVYSGDRNMFVLLGNPDSATDDGGGNPIYQGMMISNSEVGERKWSVTTFTYQSICGNAIIWGASDIMCVAYKHIGRITDRITDAHERIKSIPLAGVNPNLLRLIQSMRTEKIGNTRDDVINTIVSQKYDPALTQKFVAKAIDNAENWRSQDGDPYTMYGFTNALTRTSQLFGNADERFKIDNAVAKIYNRAAKSLQIA